MSLIESLRNCIEIYERKQIEHLNHVCRSIGIGAGDVDLLGLRRDLLDGAHEHVRDDRDPQEAVMLS